MNALMKIRSGRWLYVMNIETTWGKTEQKA